MKAARGLVLTYHAIAQGRSPLVVEPALFARHVECLVEAGAVSITVSELAAALREGTLHDRSVAITFDDGFASVAEHAAPALSSRGLRATVFAVSGHVGGRATGRRNRPPLLGCPSSTPPRCVTSSRSVGRSAHTRATIDHLPLSLGRPGRAGGLPHRAGAASRRACARVRVPVRLTPCGCRGGRRRGGVRRCMHDSSESRHGGREPGRLAARRCALPPQPAAPACGRDRSRRHLPRCPAARGTGATSPRLRPPVGGMTDSSTVPAEHPQAGARRSWLTIVRSFLTLLAGEGAARVLGLASVGLLARNLVRTGSGRSFSRRRCSPGSGSSSTTALRLRARRGIARNPAAFAPTVQRVLGLRIVLGLGAAVVLVLGAQLAANTTTSAQLYSRAPLPFPWRP